MKTVQYFTDEYLEQCKSTDIKQRLQFLEDFRKLNEKKVPTKLISIKIPQNLLLAFKSRCEISGVKYQTQIKTLMSEWLSKASSI